MPGSLGERDEVCCPGHEAGRRRTIGVVAALSINPRATTPMVRRWVAGTPMRPSGPEGRCQSNPVTVAVAAAVPGNPTKPDRPALSRIRPTDFNVSDGQAGSPPPQCPPSRESLVRCRIHSDTRINVAPPGCRAWLCARRSLTATRPAPHKVHPGSPGGAPHPGSPGHEAGRRRAIGVVAALSINPRATTPMVRRWAAGTPKRHGGPEGRR